MGLKLYFNKFSQPSRAVYLFLKLNNIPFEAINVNLMTGKINDFIYDSSGLLLQIKIF